MFRRENFAIEVSVDRRDALFAKLKNFGRAAIRSRHDILGRVRPAQEVFGRCPGKTMACLKGVAVESHLLNVCTAGNVAADTVD